MVLVFSWVILSPPRTCARGTSEMGGGEGRSRAEGWRSLDFITSPAEIPKTTLQTDAHGQGSLRPGSGDTGTLNVTLC